MTAVSSVLLSLAVVSVAILLQQQPRFCWCATAWTVPSRQSGAALHAVSARSAVASHAPCEIGVASDDATVIVAPKLSAAEAQTNDDTTTEGPPPLSRALEIAQVLTQTFVLSAIASVTYSGGWPSDWNEFWLRRSSADFFSNQTDSLTPTVNGIDRQKEKTNAQRLTAAIEELGPIYVKFGQALSSRSDILPMELVNALTKLQDDMAPSFDSETAKEIMRNELLLSNSSGNANLHSNRVVAASLIDNLTTQPVAAASIGQVFKSELIGIGPVAIKIQRPGLRNLVARDAAMLRGIATWIESISLPSLLRTSSNTIIDSRDNNNHRIVKARLVEAVDEFIARVSEELDYRNEVSNMVKFANLYSHRRKNRLISSTSKVNVVVPHVYLDYCTPNIIVMEWINGTKLTDWHSSVDEKASNTEKVENLTILRSASAATLSQLFDTGVLHADPHGGNLLKVHPSSWGNEQIDDSSPQLGYLDFGMLSTVPETVRDGLVCAIAQLVFGKNVSAVADLFGELQLLHPNTLKDPHQTVALVAALDTILDDVLDFSDSVNDAGMTTSTMAVPKLRFDRLLSGLSLMVTQFALQLPPYFLNNARALATLEGIIQKLDPDHNTMEAIYPFAVKRLFGNPSGSPVVESTLTNLLRDPLSGAITLERLVLLLDDAARVSGQKRRQVARDILSTPGGRKIFRKVAFEMLARFCGKAFYRVQQGCQSLFKSRRRRRGTPYLRL